KYKSNMEKIGKLVLKLERIGEQNRHIRRDSNHYT
ncbi:unnamed protein product, partial [marine sediment metagenome]